MFYNLDINRNIPEKNSLKFHATKKKIVFKKLLNIKLYSLYFYFM